MTPVESKFWSEQRVLLVGGAGFIGHHLALHLRQLGSEVTILDGLQVNNLGYLTAGYHSTPNAPLYISFVNQRLELLHSHKIKIIVADARDYHAVSRVVAKRSRPQSCILQLLLTRTGPIKIHFLRLTTVCEP